MAYDLYRRDNLGNPRSYDAPGYFRLDIRGMAFLRPVLCFVGVVGAPFICWEAKARARETALVPSRMLCTNEKWWVSPEQCATLAATLDALVERTTARIEPTPDERWKLELIQYFAEFCRLSVAHDGFEVW